MVGVGVNIAKAKGMFFSAPKVLGAVNKGERRALSRSGALVRTIAKRSIRKRKKPSQPGQPPSSHSGLLKRFIFFGYDPATRSVVVGPAPLGMGTDAQQTLEFGGRAKQRLKKLQTNFAVGDHGPIAFSDSRGGRVGGRDKYIMQVPIAGGKLHVLRVLLKTERMVARARRTQREINRLRAGKGSGPLVAARPYMGPALEAARPKLAAHWRNSVKA
jgi:hypothetical protein